MYSLMFKFIRKFDKNTKYLYHNMSPYEPSDVLRVLGDLSSCNNSLFCGPVHKKFMFTMTLSFSVILQDSAFLYFYFQIFLYIYL